MVLLHPHTETPAHSRLVGDDLVVILRSSFNCYSLASLNHPPTRLQIHHCDMTILALDTELRS